MITEFTSPAHALSFVSVVGSHHKLKELVKNGFLSQAAYDQIKAYEKQSRERYITLVSINDGDSIYETMLLIPESSLSPSDWIKQLHINLNTAYCDLVPVTKNVLESLHDDVKAKVVEIIRYHFDNNHVLTSIYNILNTED